MQTHIPRLTAITIFSLLFHCCRKETLNNQLIEKEFIETESAILEAKYSNLGDFIGGYYSALPVHYHETSKRYPLLIFLHGNAQFGNGQSQLDYVLAGGVPKLLRDKLFPPCFNVNGKIFSFIVLIPQFSSWPTNQKVLSFIDYAKKNYRIDSSRIYMSGLSSGGVITSDVAAEFGSILAAIVPIAGVSRSNRAEKCGNLARANLPIWVFHNRDDDLSDVQIARSFVALIQTFKPRVVAKYTELTPYGLHGHDAWTTATDPNYREENMNIYEWMLQYSR